eukprot:6191102-Amphidinium_carterae.1
MDAKIQAYVACRSELLTFIDRQNCAPILIRLAWHDSGNYDKRISSWPECASHSSCTQQSEWRIANQRTYHLSDKS